jgi:hypothetical protein
MRGEDLFAILPCEAEIIRDTARDRLVGDKIRPWAEGEGAILGVVKTEHSSLLAPQDCIEPCAATIERAVRARR